MSERPAAQGELTQGYRLAPAAPLWRLVPTRGGDGRCLADFMMLIPGLNTRPRPAREHVAKVVREVCEAYGEQVRFADINCKINVLWVSLEADPGLAGRLARSIQQRVPEALLIGGHLGAAALLPATVAARRPLWQRLRQLSRRWVVARLASSDPD
jgi:hypothetical protein